MANFNVTLPKTRFTPLIMPERANGFTHKFSVLYSDIAVAAASGATDTITVTLGSGTPARFIVTQAMAVISTLFAGSGGLGVSVGSSVTPTIFLPATSVLAGSVIQPTTGPNTIATPASGFGTTAIVPTAVFTNSVSGSPSTLTAGQLDIYLTILDLTQLG